MASGELIPDAVGQARLNACVLCRACETVCPARVPFARLMDQTRARWPMRRLWFGALFLHKFGKALARGSAWLGVASGMVRWLRLRIRHPLLEMLPSKLVLHRRALAQQAAGDDVGLFVACVTDAIDRATLIDAAVLLECSGARVRWVEGGGCCGALPRHQGDAEGAATRLRQNTACTEACSCNVLISVATGCAAEFMEYPRYSEDPQAQSWAVRHREVMNYLQTVQGRLKFRSCSRKVWLHQPCSAQHTLKESDAARALLASIPQLRLKEANGQFCCGAGGVSMFHSLQQAQELGERVVGEFLESGSDILLTSNIGCALHLRRILRADGHAHAVRHPVNLLREQLQEQPTDA